MKFKKKEIESLEKKWKASESVNKQLICELEKTITINTDLTDRIRMAEEYINAKSIEENIKINNDSRDHKKENVLLTIYYLG